MNNSKRDIRVDSIQRVNEIVAHFQNPLIDKVKEPLGDGDVVIGDIATGILSIGERTYIDAQKFFNLWRKGEMTEAQFVSAITVKIPRAKEILDENCFTRVSRKFPASPSLRVTRLKGVEIALVDCIRDLDKAIAPGFSVTA